MKLLLPTSLLLLSVTGISQDILYSETFNGTNTFTLNTTDLGGSASAENPWVVNNAYTGGTGSFMCLGFPFPFTVPSCANQPAGITSNPNSPYLHISPQIAIAAGGAIPAASFVAADGFCIFGGQSTFSRMTTDISTVGYDSVTLDLWWMCGGSSAYYGEVYYSTDGGLGWTILTNPESGTTQWSNEASWINSVLTHANLDDQPTLRFGFRFVSGSVATGGETDPGFAVDDIEITGYTTCSPTSSTITAEACEDGYTSPSGLYTWITSGIHMDTIPNMAGCDSVITVDLTINNVDQSVTQTGITLMADNGTATSYQWVDCNNGNAPISGATSQSYTPTADGSYAVEVTDNGCTETSSCFTISGVGIETDQAFPISIFPNPANQFLQIEFDSNEPATLVLRDIAGREIQSIMLNPGVNTLSLSAISKGSYSLTIVSSENETLFSEMLIVE